jgi:hypothetical protein
MGAGVAVRAVILGYLDQVARVRSIRRAAEDLPAERGPGLLRNGAAMGIEVRAGCFWRGPAKLLVAAGGQRKALSAASG